MESNQIRKVGLISVEDRTAEDTELYSIYTKARDNISGSFVKLQEDLGMSSVEFYHRLECDHLFCEAIKQGLDDGRYQRILELESAMIRLALGTSTDSVKTNTITNTDGNGVVITTVDETVDHREYLPNLSALQVLLEKIHGKSWSVTQKVSFESDQATPNEVPYDLLSNKQLKKLAEMKEKK